jgi:hypothetical protein
MKKNNINLNGPYYREIKEMLEKEQKEKAPLYCKICNEVIDDFWKERGADTCMHCRRFLNKIEDERRTKISQEKVREYLVANKK